MTEEHTDQGESTPTGSGCVRYLLVRRRGGRVVSHLKIVHPKHSSLRLLVYILERLTCIA